MFKIKVVTAAVSSAAVAPIFRVSQVKIVCIYTPPSGPELNASSIRSFTIIIILIIVCCNLRYKLA